MIPEQHVQEILDMMRFPVIERELTIDWLEIEPNTMIYGKQEFYDFSNAPRGLTYPTPPPFTTVKLTIHFVVDGTPYLVGEHFVHRGRERVKRVLISRFDDNEKPAG